MLLVRPAVWFTIANAYRVFGSSTIVIVDKQGVIRFIIGNTSGLETLVEHLLR